MKRFIVTAALGAGLLFLVQPLVARALLPWFGGSAAVWTTCQLFFQLLLLGGYGWTHGLVARLPPARQVLAQRLLVGAAVASLVATAAWWGAPLVPGETLRPTDSTWPIARLLGTLLLAVGLPYFALATSAPLLQAWALRARVTRGSVYRLYAVSNAGSLLGLVLYPFGLEPVLPLRWQGWGWAAGFAGWAVGVVLAGRRLEDAAAGSDEAPAAPEAPRAWGRWLALSAGPVMLLLSVTNHLTQEVAPVPFLWVLPLAAYLVSFILTFESDRWYRPRVALPLLAVLALGVASARGLQTRLPVQLGVLLFVGFLFVACIAAHGELARLRPQAHALTAFYATTALGGALGGLFVALLAPKLFPDFHELELGVLFVAVAVTLQLRARTALAVAWVLVATLAAVFSLGIHERLTGVIAARRDFFGVVRVVVAGDGDDEALLLMHGRTVHGAQQRYHREATTTYYGPESGVGQLLSRPREAPRKVGVIGLGIGTLAAYGRPGDTYRFYEISPTVVAFAQGEEDTFTFLRDSKAKVEVALGDARSTLEREPPQGFDVLVLDAFSSDSVPVHLLTKEALTLYLRHLAPGGVLVFHVSNQSLNLVPVAARVGRALGLVPAVAYAEPHTAWPLPSRWLLLARDAASFEGVTITDAQPPTNGPLWTDDFSSLWPIVRW